MQHNSPNRPIVGLRAPKRFIFIPFVRKGRFQLTIEHIIADGYDPIILGFEELYTLFSFARLLFLPDPQPTHLSPTLREEFARWPAFIYCGILPTRLISHIDCICKYYIPFINNLEAMIIPSLYFTFGFFKMERVKQK